MSSLFLKASPQSDYKKYFFLFTLMFFLLTYTFKKLPLATLLMAKKIVMKLNCEQSCAFSSWCSHPPDSSPKISPQRIQSSFSSIPVRRLRDFGSAVKNNSLPRGVELKTGQGENRFSEVWLIFFFFFLMLCTPLRISWGKASENLRLRHQDAPPTRTNLLFCLVYLYKWT